MVDVSMIISPGGFVTLLLVTVWSTVWAGIAMWRCARNRQLVWFLINFLGYIFVLNVVGLVSIIYMAFFQRNRNKSMPVVIHEIKKPVIKKPTAKKTTKKTSKKKK